MATIVDYIPYCFNSRFGANRDFSSSWYRPPKFDEFEIFSKFVKVDLTSSVIEVPCVFKYIVEYALKDNLDNEKKQLPLVKDLFIPLVSCDDDETAVRGSSPAIRKFFRDTSPCCGLSKKAVGESIYYGGEGFIAYKDLTPLVMFTLKIQRDPGTAYKYTPIRQVVHINPTVYERDDILSKYVKSKLISGCVELKRKVENLRYPYMYNLSDPAQLFSSTKLSHDFQIIIEDFSDFFVSPNVPNATFDSEKVNAMLCDDLEEVLSEIKIREQGSQNYVFR